MIDLNPNATLVKAETKWTTSRARDTAGYNVCNLYVKGYKVASTCGGGYDMIGTVFAEYIQDNYAEHLRRLIKEPHYGLKFANPNHNPGAEIVPGTGQTVEQREKEGKEITALGLERLQAFYSATSDVPTEVHTVPLLDGACGRASIEKIFATIGGKIKWLGKLGRSRDNERWELFLPSPLPASEAA